VVRTEDPAVEGARRAVLTALYAAINTLYGNVQEKIENRIQQIKDISVLEELVVFTCKSKSLDELVQKLEGTV